MLIVIPYLLLLLGIPGIMSIPFYFFNRWLMLQLKPRESFNKFWMYIFVVLSVAFVYMTIVLYLVIISLQFFNNK